jgi:hypothetical protein
MEQDWTAFKDIIATSLMVNDRFETACRAANKKYGNSYTYWPVTVRRSIETIKRKMEEHDRLALELAKALVREERKEKNDGSQG